MTEYQATADYAKAQDTGRAHGQHPGSRVANFDGTAVSATTERKASMAKQRISYVPLEKMDAKMREEMERCQREGTPRPESSAIRAHVPACFWFFANSWNDIFRNGVLDHAIKELCRLYVSRSVQCEYCGNQRSVKSTTSGALIEDHVLDLLNFEKSAKLRRAPEGGAGLRRGDHLASQTDDAFWDRLHKHFSEPELVELGCMIGLTLGQQSWLRLAQHRAPSGAGRHRSLRWRPATRTWTSSR